MKNLYHYDSIRIKLGRDACKYGYHEYFLKPGERRLHDIYICSQCGTEAVLEDGLYKVIDTFRDKLREWFRRTEYDKIKPKDSERSEFTHAICMHCEKEIKFNSHTLGEQKKELKKLKKESCPVPKSEYFGGKHVFLVGNGDWRRSRFGPNRSISATHTSRYFGSDVFDM